jgi:hypothetical protein
MKDQMLLVGELDGRNHEFDYSNSVGSNIQFIRLFRAIHDKAEAR